MPENTEEKLPQESQIKPPEYSASKKPLFLIILLLVISVLILIALVFVLISSKNKSQKAPIPTVVPTQTQDTNVPTSVISPTTQVPNPLVVYIREGNIWSVKSDGTSVRQLTRDGDNNSIRYSSLDFINKEEIGFIRCETNINTCTIQNKNLTNNEEKTILKKENSISVFTVDSNSKLIAYIGDNSEELPTLYFFENGNEKKILDFQASLGRGGGLNDEISLSFSTDNRYLLVVNTATQPNSVDDKKTIWVIDRLGNVIDSIQKGFATDAVWDMTNRFLYKDGEAIFKKTVGGLEESLGNLPGYDISISLDKKNILIWNVSDNGQTNLSSYVINSKSSSELKKDLGYPKWLDSKDVVAIKTAQSSDSYLGFTTNGLVKYNIDSKEEKVLDSNSSIYQFIIQPE